MAVLEVYARQVDPVFTSAGAGGDTFRNDGATELLVYNPGILSITVTAAAQRRCSHGFMDDWEVTVEAGQVFPFGPFPASRFNDSSGLVSISYSSVAGITVSAKRQQ